MKKKVCNNKHRKQWLKEMLLKFIVNVDAISSKIREKVNKAKEASNVAKAKVKAAEQVIRPEIN